MNATTLPPSPALARDPFRLAYLLLSFGLLASVAYRGFVRQESAWDLLALVLLGGLVTTWYRGRGDAASSRSALASLAAMVVALFLGAALAAVVR